MTTPELEDPQSRPLASYETGFWAFLEYPAFWIPALSFTFYMLVALIVLMVTGGEVVMFTVIRTRKLAALREEAAQLPRLRCQVTESRHAAEAADAEAARLTAELDAAIAEAGGRLARLLAAAGDPVTGGSIRAGIALHVVRDMLAEVKASGDDAAIEGIRVMDALLGEDPPFPAPSTRPAASLSTASCEPGSSPQHAPGGAHR